MWSLVIQTRITIRGRFWLILKLKLLKGNQPSGLNKALDQIFATSKGNTEENIDASPAVNVAINNSKTRKIDEVINVDEPETDTVIVELHNQNLETETEVNEPLEEGLVAEQNNSDDTQLDVEVQNLNIEHANVDITVDVQNDINFLKQSWANMTELE
ncbi:hypothetical protein L195_g042305, partial [Trifolium pratense]